MTDVIDLEVQVLRQAATLLRDSKTLLHGQYSGMVGDTECYCTVGAIRRALWKARRDHLAAEFLDAGTIATEVAKTLPDFDPVGYELLKALNAPHMNRDDVFVYNDYILAPIELSTGKHLSDHAAAREKAADLLEATADRLEVLDTKKQA